VIDFLIRSCQRITGENLTKVVSKYTGSMSHFIDQECFASDSYVRWKGEAWYLVELYNNYLGSWDACVGHMKYHNESTHFPTCFVECHYNKILLPSLKQWLCRWALFLFDHHLLVVRIRSMSMFALGRTVINKWETVHTLDLEKMDIVVDGSLQEFGR
jgi:hypothetical protein